MILFQVGIIDDQHHQVMTRASGYGGMISIMNYRYMCNTYTNADLDYINWAQPVDHIHTTHGIYMNMW